ncbi:MAG TPA: cytochrome c oxidase assembly protein [Thermoleophilaceae bacterium]|nr:cytochrome c oxidase assembly protein [Thermoleophilaceae bacterium]
MISLDPAGLVLVALLVGLYLRAVRVLGRRGYAVPRGQQVAWYAGVALLAAGLLGPVDHLADDLLTAHMAQHLLMADLAAPFLLAGARSPVLFFMLPRPVLVRLARRRRLRAAFRVLRRPLVALPIYLVILYTWHFAFAMDAALGNEWVHGIQHQMFLLAAVLVWWPAIEPHRRPMPGELWKAGYILGARVLAMFVGMGLLISRTPAYDYYVERGGSHGLTPLDDQQLAGGLMLMVDVVVMIVALAYFFLRAGEAEDRRLASGSAPPTPRPARGA